MQIKRLRLAGFKSFVDPAELRIEPGLTGVVGPNGCGKSNLLEAVRWAMGATSAKAMRGADMDDVIFAGSNVRPAREHAEVVLVLDAEGVDDKGVNRVVRRTHYERAAAPKRRDHRCAPVGVTLSRNASPSPAVTRVPPPKSTVPENTPPTCTLPLGSSATPCPAAEPNAVMVPPYRRDHRCVPAGV